MIDNREWALLIWLGAGLALFLLLGSLRSILFGVVRTVLNPVLVIPVLLMAGWVGGTVFAAIRIGWWEVELATETAEWFLGTALVLMFSVNEALREEHFFRRTIIKCCEGHCPCCGAYQPLCLQAVDRVDTTADFDGSSDALPGG